ncbi:MAG: hypothetical protein EBU49_06645, partial [Proteobacteria bacterium]|nr:hypothetical protein [Pseudomonadota bacterium]
CAALALRLIGREGTHVPGRIALWVCPDLLAVIARPETVIVVTGTNGKTTTTNLLADALSALDLSVSTNRAGSNLRDGIVASLVSGVNIWGKNRRDGVGRQDVGRDCLCAAWGDGSFGYHGAACAAVVKGHRCCFAQGKPNRWNQ